MEGTLYHPLRWFVCPCVVATDNDPNAGILEEQHTVYGSSIQFSFVAADLRHRQLIIYNEQGNIHLTQQIHFFATPMYFQNVLF